MLVGLAHDAQCRLDGDCRDPVDETEHAGAAQLLVIGYGDMDRHLEIAPAQFGHEGQDDAEEAFHVAGAAAIKSTVGLPHDERIAAPGLVLDRHDIAVTGKNHARPIRRPDRRPEIPLLASAFQMISERTPCRAR
jgi:hypothetical protein